MAQRKITEAQLAKGRKAFVEAAVESLGGDDAAAKRLGVTRAAFWQWANKSLSVEGAVALAEATGQPLEGAVRWANRRLVVQPVPSTRAKAA